LHSLGYALDFKQKRVVKTGMLSVETNVGGTEIYMDGKLKGKTGAIFKNALEKNLLPKTYKIELKKDGYYPWQKNLEIKEMLATEIKSILLLPAVSQKQLVLEKKVQSFFVSPDERKIAYTLPNNKLEVLNLDNQNTYSILGADKIDLVFWAADSKSLFFRAQADKKISYFVWQEDDLVPTDLNKFLNGIVNPVEFKWHPKDSTQIYFLSRKGNSASLYKIDFLNKAVLPEILKNVKNYEISDDGIYFLDKKSGFLFKTDFEGKSRQQLTLLALPNYNEKDDYKIIPLGSKIYLIDGNGNFYILNSDLKIFEKSGENIKEVKLSGDSKKLLYYGENEVWVLYLEDFLIQPFHYKGDKELIARFSSPIENVFWYPDDGHLIIIVQNIAKITELDGRDVRNTVDFLTGEQIDYVRAEKEIYFLENGNLYSAKL